MSLQFCAIMRWRTSRSGRPAPRAGVDYARDLLKIDLRCACDEQNAPRAAREDLRETDRPDLCHSTGCVLIVSARFASTLIDDVAAVRSKAAFAGAGMLRLQTVLLAGQDHHENDQQHQQHVDQRRDIDFGAIGGSSRHAAMDTTAMCGKVPRSKNAPVDILPEEAYSSRRMSTGSDSRLDLLQGTLDMLILRTLLLGPGHGHAIATAIERGSQEVLQVEHGSLYPALHRLEKQGLIATKDGVSENRRRARYYSLTAKGRKRLTAESSKWARLTEAIARIMHPAEES